MSRCVVFSLVSDPSAGISGAPLLDAFLTPEARTRFQQVCAYLTDLGIPHVITPHLLHAHNTTYMHTIFNIIDRHQTDATHEMIVEGGRYDNIIGTITKGHRKGVAAG